MEISVEGKVVLITGATSGIGLATARELSRMGAKVTIVSRNPEKCACVAREITKETGNPVEQFAADLSSLDGIRKGAQEFRERHDRLDVLINNAGAMFSRRYVTVDGYEMTFALNHLNYFLLTNLLLDLVKTSAPARIICVSSDAHISATIDFDDLMGEKHYRFMKAYGQSKLANVLFTNELARRLQGTGVTVNALHPGLIATGFARNNGIVYNIAMALIGLFITKPEQGAQTSIYLASSPDVEGVTGKYFYQCKPIPSQPLSYDEALAKKLWQVSLELTGLPPES